MTSMAAAGVGSPLKKPGIGCFIQGKVNQPAHTHQRIKNRNPAHGQVGEAALAELAQVM
jgi:hypothetical protein